MEISAGTKSYKSNRGLLVLMTGMVYGDGKKWIHVSVSRRSRLPDWRDLKTIKNLFIGPDKLAIQVFPAQADYVNIHPNCLHLWHCLDGDPVPDFQVIRGMI